MNFRNALASALYTSDFGGALDRDTERKAREEERQERERRMALDDYDRTGRWDEKVLGPRQDADAKVDSGAMDDDDRKAVSGAVSVANLAAGLTGMPKYDASDTGKVDKWKSGPVPDLKYDYTKSKEYDDIRQLAMNRRSRGKEVFDFTKAATEQNPDLNFSQVHRQARAGRGEPYVKDATERAEHTKRFDAAVADGVFKLGMNRALMAQAVADPKSLDQALRNWQNENDPDTKLSREARELGMQADRARLGEISASREERDNTRRQRETTEQASSAATAILRTARRIAGDDRQKMFALAERAAAGADERTRDEIRAILAEEEAAYNATVDEGRARQEGQTTPLTADAANERLQSMIQEIMDNDEIDDDTKREDIAALKARYQQN